MSRTLPPSLSLPFQPLIDGQSSTSISSGQQAVQLHIEQALERRALMTSHCNPEMKNIVEAHGSGQMSSEPVCAAAAYVAVATAPAAAAARDTKSASCNPFNLSSASFSSSTSSLTTTCPSSSSCASSCCSSCSCASCPSCTAAPWREYNTEVIGKCDNEITYGGGHYDRGSGDETRGEIQRQRPDVPQHSSRVGSFPPSQPTQAAVSAALSIVDKEAHSILSTSGTPPSSDFLAPPLASTVPIAGSRSECNPQTVVPVPQPTGFRRMPRDPVSGRRICFYFNHTGCTAGTRCAYMHVKRDISDIIPGAFHKPAVPSTPSSVGPLPLLPSPSFPVDANLPSFPAALPNYVPPGPPLSLPATPAYVMYYVGVPSSYSRALPSSYSPSLPHFCHGGAGPPLPMVLGGDREVRMQGRGGDAQWYHHQMQPRQQVAGAMDEEWAGGMMDVGGVDMQYHQQRAYYEQHYHYYPYQQTLQQDG